MSDPYRPEPPVPLSMRPTVYREARFISRPTWRSRLRALAGEALDLPPSQALAAVAGGGAVGLVLVILVAVCVAEAL